MRETFGHARGFQNFRALNEFTTLYPNPSALCGSSGRLEKGENQDVNKMFLADLILHLSFEFAKIAAQLHRENCGMRTAFQTERTKALR